MLTRKKATESAMCYLLTISLFGMQTANKNPLKRLCFSGFSNLSFSKCGATSNIKVKSQSIRLNRTLFKSSDYQSF